MGRRAAVDCEVFRGELAGESVTPAPFPDLGVDVAGVVPSFDDNCPRLSECGKLPVDGLVLST